MPGRQGILCRYLYNLMKISVYGIGLIVMATQLLLAGVSGAQDIRDANVTIGLEKASLRDALQKLQQESGYNIFYLSKAVSPFDNITLRREPRTVQKTLELILDRTNLVFRQEGKNIILTEHEVPAPEPRAKPPVKGKVTDKDGQGLPGVSVIVKGTSHGTITDQNGNYNLEFQEDNPVLIFSFVGYVAQEMEVGKREVLDVVLATDEKALEEVIVVGYGTQKKVNLTGAVSNVSGSDLITRQAPNTTSLLQGRMPGVQVTQNSGQPGAENASIQIRGQGTFSGAGNDPLILIDGVEGNLNNVNPNQIESISVLKDAASAAIYGSRAANGVIDRKSVV